MAVDSQQRGMPTEAVEGPRRRFQFTIKALLLFTAYIAVQLSILVTLVSSRSYGATAWIRCASPARGQPVPPDRNEAVFETEVRGPILRSEVLAGAAGRPEMAKLSVFPRHQSRTDWLAEHIEVERVGGSELVAVSLTARDPEDAAKIVNAVVDAYLQWRTERSPEAARFRRQLQALEEERERRAVELRRLAEDVGKLAQRASTDGDSGRVAPERAAGEPPVDDVSERLARQEGERALLEAELAALGAEMEGEVEADAARAPQERIEAIQSRIDAHRAAESALRRERRERIEDWAGGDGELVEWGLARAELARVERVYEIVSNRILLLNTENLAQQRVQLLGKAPVPGTASTSIPYTTIVAVIAIWFAPLPFLAAGLWRAPRQRRVKS
ncbi:MAG TPA: hypothetical protein VMY37_03920 [Thermoguttaceae bacterium]|nr:hypothetical protein [Thermoguttaceae bacterium]